MADQFPPAFNLTAHVLARAADLGPRPALCVLGETPETFSYGDLQAAVLGTATGLRALGLAPGARILMRLGNTVDFPILYLAALAVDLIPVPTSAQLTAPEIDAMAARIAPALIAAAPGIALPPSCAAPVLTLDALRALRDNPPATPVMGVPDRPGYIVFSSGTSGTPQGVVHAHRAILGRHAMIDGWSGLCPDDRLLHAGAFNWTYTLGTGLLDPWRVGATALIPGPGTVPRDLPDLLREYKATILAAAPGVYRQLLRQDMKPVATLRHGLSAGEKLPETTRAAWERATGTPIYEAYGLSECSTFISGNPAAPARPGTLGRPQPGRRVVILGDGGTLPAGEPGVIAVHRSDPGLMTGYLDDPVATASRMRGDWFVTGDVATMDADGSVTYLGRDDDMMNAGGYRVSPVEVETALASFPGLHESAAIETAVKSDATVIAALYVADTALDPQALGAHCATRLARYKCPRLFARIDTLPRGANGKILRRRLRETFKAMP